MLRLALSLFLSLWFCLGASAQPDYPRKKFPPVNKNATKEAKALLKYLYKIRGKQIIAGHHNYAHELSMYSQRAREITGEYPALWGGDFSWLRGYTQQLVVDEAIKQHKKGAIITLMWHAGRPQDDMPILWKENVQAEVTEEEWDQITTPGIELHRRWQAKADSVAFFLKQLQEANIPVLWRPYHEMNGIWFWWGDKKGEDGFIKLWKMIYDRFVNHHQLNNLIWVWNANAPRDRENDEAYAYEDYYPGNEYVDVLAADVYHNDYRPEHHDQLIELGEGRLIALGEVGEVPTPAALDRQSQWAWFMIWTKWIDSANTPEKVQALYNDPRVLSLKEISTPWKK